MNFNNIKFLSRVDPLIDSLPEYLKDPQHFEKIQKAIIETVKACKKAHVNLLEMAECETCTENMLIRRALLKKLGFKNARQYYAWRKIHEKIRKMMPLVNWKK